MRKEWKLAAAGDNCMDVYDASGKAFPGGNPVNVAVYTCRQGGCASYTGAVGDDAFGGQMRRALVREGVDVSHLHVLHGATAVSHVALTGGERVFGEYEEGVMAGFRLSDDDIDFLCGHDMAVSGLWGHIHEDLPRLRLRGLTTAFDFADKPDGSVARIALPWVNYAFFSDDTADDTQLKHRLRTLRASGPEVVVATRGARGSIAFDGEHFIRQAAITCRVVDTMGAGDSFIAGFLFERMRGGSLQNCMARGALCSAETIGYRGAW